MSPFIVMTGSSGVGKTTIARRVRCLYPEVSVNLEEELALPTDEFWERIGPTDGPGGPIQRGIALYSIPLLAAARTDGRPVLLDCQCRIAFLQEAIVKGLVPGGRIVLIECDDITREQRLHGRGSPELAHEQMRSWSRYLHQEALEADLPILVTHPDSLDTIVERICTYLQLA